MPAAHLRLHEVPGSHAACAQLERVVQKRAELDLAVAQHVGVGRAAAPVLVQKIGKDPVVIFLFKVDGIAGDADGIAYALHVVPVVGGGAGAVFVLLVPVFHEHAHHVVALPLEQQRRHGAVHPAGHAHHDSLHPGFLPLQARRSGSRRSSTASSASLATSSTPRAASTTTKRRRLSRTRRS